MRRFFNFIKNLLILAIMAAAVVNYHEQIQTFLLEAAGTASTYLEQKGLKSKTLDLSGGIVAESNKKVTKNTTGYRWPKATAKVYIGVKQTDLYNATVNAMAAWKVEPEKADLAGRQMAEFPEVSHCYLRQVPNSFPYNLFTMIHARSDAQLSEIIARAADETELNDYLIIKSLKEYKKASMKYV